MSSDPFPSASSSRPIRARTAGGRAVVIITGDDVYEDIFTAAIELQDILSSAGFSARVGMGTARLSDSDDREDGIGPDDLIVLYTAAGEFARPVQEALVRRVQGGAGLVAIHASNVVPADAPMAGLVGSSYRSHGPRPHESRYRVELDASHEIVRGLEPFELTHEHYLLDLHASVHTVAWRETEHGREPLVHVQEIGDGRVCYIQFGHDMRSWGEPAVRTLVRRAARWATRGEAS